MVVTAGTNNSNWIRASGNQVDLNTNGGGYGFEVSGNTQLLIATNGAVTSHLYNHDGNLWVKYQTKHSKKI